MRPFIAANIILLFAAAIFTSSAQALGPIGEAWIASNGSDSNQCSIPSTPCATLAGAYSEISPGGTINCVDNTSNIIVSPVTITHSVTIDCRSVSLVLFANGNGVITVNAGPTDAIILRGIEFESYELQSFAPGMIGIDLVAGGAVTVEDCTFRNFVTAGIEFTPSSGTSQLFVRNSTIQHNAAGVMIKPGASGNVTASFDHVAITNNTGGGIKIDTTNGPVTVDITDSEINSNSGNGMNAVGGAGGPAMFSIHNSVIAKNGAAGVQANGPSAAAMIDTTLLDSNTNGATTVINGGRILTYGNNRIVGGSGSGFTGSASLQ